MPERIYENLQYIDFSNADSTDLSQSLNSKVAFVQYRMLLRTVWKTLQNNNVYRQLQSVP